MQIVNMATNGKCTCRLNPRILHLSHGRSTACSDGDTSLHKHDISEATVVVELSTSHMVDLRPAVTVTRHYTSMTCSVSSSRNYMQMLGILVEPGLLTNANAFECAFECWAFEFKFLNKICNAFALKCIP